MIYERCARGLMVEIKVRPEQMERLKVPNLMRLLGEAHEEGAKLALVELKLNPEGMFLKVVAPLDMTLDQIAKVRDDLQERLEAKVRALLDEQSAVTIP